MDVPDNLRQLIIEDIGWKGSPEMLTGDINLLENDVIDSMQLIQLIELIEEKMHVHIDDTELVPDNFTTIDQLTRLINSKVPD